MHMDSLQCICNTTTCYNNHSADSKPRTASGMQRGAGVEVLKNLIGVDNSTYTQNSTTIRRQIYKKKFHMFMYNNCII